MSKEIIKECRDRNSAYVFRNIFTDLPSWEDFFNHISDALETKDYAGGNHGSKEVVGKVNFWSRLTMTLEQPTTKYYKNLDLYANTLQELQDYKLNGYFCAVSITNNEPTTGSHSDPIDVIYLQCIGNVKWNIYKDTTEEYILGPGDAIYVPAEVMHEVFSLTPRAAISFMFAKE
jgi:ribosomal protein L16 Arg81 hydroxylase